MLWRKNSISKCQNLTSLRQMVAILNYFFSKTKVKWTFGTFKWTADRRIRDWTDNQNDMKALLLPSNITTTNHLYSSLALYSCIRTHVLVRNFLITSWLFISLKSPLHIGTMNSYMRELSIIKLQYSAVFRIWEKNTISRTIMVWSLRDICKISQLSSPSRSQVSVAALIET